MKIVVSYLSSFEGKRKSIELIDETTAYGVHADLMDGSYCGVKNFNVDELKGLFEGIKKPIDVHMMIDKPSRYLNDIIALNPECVYVHPKTEEGLDDVFSILENNNIKKGIAINPNEGILEFEYLYRDVDRVLLMSVVPGKGGQSFIEDSESRLENLANLGKEYGFEVFVDGGINDQTISKVRLADGIVSGSFVCKSDDYEVQLTRLRSSIK